MIRRLADTHAVLLVEHDAEMVMSLADRIYVLVNGRIAFSGIAEEFDRNSALKESLLGLAPGGARGEHRSENLVVTNSD